MAVTESDPDPKVRKNVCTFLMTVRPLSWNVTGSKRIYFGLDYPTGSLIYDRPKEMSHDFVRGQSVAEACFSHWG